MRKVLVLIITFLMVGSLYANIEPGVGFVYVEDNFNNDTTGGILTQNIAGYANLKVYDLYASNDIGVIATKDYIDAKDTLTFYLWNPANLNVNVKGNFEYCWTPMSHIIHADAGISASYFVIVNKWLTTGAIGYIGYCPVDKYILPNKTTDNGNSLCTKIELWARLWNHIEVYAGMESLEIYKMGMSSMTPLNIKNTIGIKAYYRIKRAYLFASVDYFCQHPEIAWNNKNINNINRSQLICNVGVKIKCF